MSRIIRKHTVYAAWDYEKEIADLNRLSAEGMQLVKGGCFSSKYEEDKSVQYRYQLDYNRCIDNRMRYIESFREQGWEYINSTFNGWHYFRKQYDPSLPESEYEIYTDMPSRSEMAGRWMKLGYIVCIFLLLLFLVTLYQMIRQPEIWRLSLLLEYAVLSIMIAIGLRSMALVVRGNADDHSRKFPVAIVFILLIISLLWSLMWMNAKDFHEGTWGGSLLQEKDYPVIEFNIRLPEFIYLTLENDRDLPATVTIVDNTGNAVFTKTGEALELEEERVFLSRGSYRLIVEYDTENLKDGNTNFQTRLKIE